MENNLALRNSADTEIPFKVVGTKQVSYASPAFISAATRAKQVRRLLCPYVNPEMIFMTYNPDIHHRQSIRLREYDYAGAERWSPEFGQCDKVESRTLTKEEHREHNKT